MNVQQMGSRMVSLLLRLLGAALLAHVLLVYVPFSPVALMLVLLVAGVAILLPPSKVVTMAVSLALLTAMLELAVRWGGLNVTPYYRPHEMLALDTSYRPNRTVEMLVPHGDLVNIDAALSGSLEVPRRERFVTDSFGYRNDHDYAGEQLVLIGDSFLVGTATTLGDRLRENHGIAAYNVSFSGMGPLIYADKVQWARRTLADPICIAQFYFEGNDFRPVDPADLVARDRVPRQYQLMVKNYVQGIRRNSEWAKVFFGLLARAQENVKQSRRSSATESPAPSEPVTMLATASGVPIAFLNGYAEVTRRESFNDHDFVRSRLRDGKPDIVLFIPEKFRIYAPLLDQRPEAGLPHAQWNYLKKAADAVGVHAVDLTAPLSIRATELLADGELLFWPDDTHWNHHGEDVAAEILVEALRVSQNATCRGVVGMGLTGAAVGSIAPN